MGIVSVNLRGDSGFQSMIPTRSRPLGARSWRVKSPDGDAVLAHDRDNGSMCSCCFNSSRPQRLQSKAMPLVESRRTQIIVRSSQSTLERTSAFE